MSHVQLAPTLLALAATAALGGAETSFLDLRLGAGVLATEYKGASNTTVYNRSTQVTTVSNTGEDGRNADSNYRGQLQLVWGDLGPAGGLILGGGVAMNQSRFDDGFQETRVTTPVVNVLAGYGIAVLPQWHFELTPFAGAGRAYYSVKNQWATDTSKEWSKYMEYGAKIGTYVTVLDFLQAGLEVPYLVGRFDPEYDHDDGLDSYTVSDNRRNQGFGLLFTLGARF
jgi:hypothetical protein